MLASAVASTPIVIPLFSGFVRPRQRASLMGPLAVLTCGTLALTALRPGLAVSLVIFSLSAAFSVYQIYRYFVEPSGWLIALTVLDVIVIVLTWFEWQRVKQERQM